MDVNEELQALKNRIEALEQGPTITNINLINPKEGDVIHAEYNIGLMPSSKAHAQVELVLKELKATFPNNKVIVSAYRHDQGDLSFSTRNTDE